MTGFRAVAAVLLVLVFPAVAADAATKQDFEESVSADGLEKVKVKGIDLAYVRPGAALGSYAAVMIEPVSVAFRKDFKPAAAGSRMPLTAAELNDIREGVGALVQEEFRRELVQGSYELATQAGPDVLQLRASIVDLYVNAPDTLEAGRTRSYTLSAGEMTLVLELADSATGEVLARAYDRREGRETHGLTWTSGVTNRAEAQAAAQAWARILRSRLDAARGIGK